MVCYRLLVPFELHNARFEVVDDFVELGDASPRVAEGFADQDDVVASGS